MAKLETLTKEDFLQLIEEDSRISEPYFSEFMSKYKKTDFKEYEKATFKNGCSVVMLSINYGYFAFVDNEGNVKKVSNIYEPGGISYDKHLDVAILSGHEDIVLVASDGYISFRFG